MFKLSGIIIVSDVTSSSFVFDRAGLPFSNPNVRRKSPLSVSSSCSLLCLSNALGTSILFVYSIIASPERLPRCAKVSACCRNACLVLGFSMKKDGSGIFPAAIIGFGCANLFPLFNKRLCHSLIVLGLSIHLIPTFSIALIADWQHSFHVILSSLLRPIFSFAVSNARQMYLHLYLILSF